MLQATSPSDVFSWSNEDPRESQLFNSHGPAYRFQTNVASNGQSTTTLWRTIRSNKEDRVAKLEWASNGGLGRVVIGKSTMPMQDLVCRETHDIATRVFYAPNGAKYCWSPSTHGPETLLYDENGEVIAFYRPIRPVRYSSPPADVYGELHLIRTAGRGTVTHPPVMDMVAISAMLYRFCAKYGL
jgi:hypothetical protein